MWRAFTGLLMKKVAQGCSDTCMFGTSLIFSEDVRWVPPRESPSTSHRRRISTSGTQRCCTGKRESMRAPAHCYQDDDYD